MRCSAGVLDNEATMRTSTATPKKTRGLNELFFTVYNNKKDKAHNILLRRNGIACKK
jgi:hypothetical protein